MSLKGHCDDVGIEFMSTPFDSESAACFNDIVAERNGAWADLTNHPFLRQIAGYGRPILLSTGASTAREIEAALSQVALCRACVPDALHPELSDRPAENANLGMILGLRERFPGHVPGLVRPHRAGWRDVRARYRRAPRRTDHRKALYVRQVASRKRPLSRNGHCGSSQLAGTSLTTPLLLSGPLTRPLFRRRSQLGALRVEAWSRRATSLPDTWSSPADLTWKRPATGISPADFDRVIGMRTREAIPEDTILEWGHVE